jgi:small subunit ribosomal protein S19
MARSSKKGPFVDPRLLAKIAKMKASGKKEPIKTWLRASQIAPEFVGMTFLVHNGKKFIEVFINEAMVGHRLGEFAPTRTFKGHGRMVKRVLTKT